MVKQDTDRPREPPPRLIVTAPAGLPGMRNYQSTFQTIRGLVESARTSILIVSYAFANLDVSLLSLLAGKMRQGVSVTFCLNEKNTSAPEELLKAWPDRSHLPRILVPNPRNWPKGNLHAKAIVVDGQSALITSANLTDSATDKNLEMGMLVHGRMARDTRDLILALEGANLLADFNG